MLGLRSAPGPVLENSGAATTARMPATHPAPPLAAPSADTAANQRVTQSILALVGPGGSGMANRNKKKGFLKEMEGKRPVKIVFGESTAPELITRDVEQQGQVLLSDIPSADMAGAAIDQVDIGNVHGVPGDDELPFASAPLGEADRQRQLAELGGVFPSSIPKALLPSNVVITSVSFPWAGNPRRNADSQPKEKGKGGVSSRARRDARRWEERVRRERAEAGEAGETGEEDIVDAAVPALDLSDSKEEPAPTTATAPWQPRTAPTADPAEIDRQWERYSKITPQWFNKLPLMLIGVGSRIATKVRLIGRQCRAELTTGHTSSLSS